MARRRTSPVEDIFDMLQQLPWWAGVIFAGVFWLVGQIFMARTGTDPLHSAFRPLLKLLFNGLAILSLGKVIPTVR